MIRPVKITFIAGLLALIAWASFAGGQRLRRAAVETVHSRVSSLPTAGIGGTEMVRAAEQDDGLDPADTFQEVLRYMKSDYVDRVDADAKLGAGAVRTMLAALDDPKTRYLEPDQRKMLEDQLNGRFTGIGAWVTISRMKKGEVEYRRLAVVAPATGGPADRAGIRPGDQITEVDGHWIIAYDPRLDLDRLRTSKMSDQEYRKAFKDATKRLTDGVTIPKALEQLTTGESKTLALTIERPGAAEPLKMTVTTAPTTVEPVEFRPLDDRAAYLRVTQFNDAATAAFEKALADMKQPALILDLRDNAGGPVTSAQAGAYGSAKALLARLTKGGQVATLLRKGNRQEPVSVTAAASGSPRLVVLVNGGTANLAEVVAAALKEKAGATLIGARTSGDGTFQKLVDLQGGAAMTLTAGKFLTSRGMDFAGKGLTPDIALATGGPRSTGDPVVERAARTLAGA